MTLLIHPRMLATLKNFFTAVVAIQTPTITRDTDGAEIKAWADVVGLSAVACDVAVASPGSIWDQAMRQSEKTEVTVTHQINPRGYYPQITTAMRVKDVNNIYYEILAVEHDSQLATTRIKARRLEPTTAEMV